MNPESGTIGYQYDNNGNLTEKTDARVPAVTSTNIYDALNRVTNRSYTDGTPAVTYAYDGTNTKGRLKSVTSSVSSYSYSVYDVLGRVLSGAQTIGGTAYTMGYEYDLAGNMKSETYPSGLVVATEFDGAGRIAGARNQATGLYYAGEVATDANSIQYSAHGAMSALKLGNGLWEHTIFNTRLQPTQIALGTASTPSSVLQLDYGYGTTTNNGNLLNQTITIPGLTLSQAYGYDRLNRLETAGENGGVSWKQMFVYPDRFGNRRIDSDPTNTTPELVGPNPVLSGANNRIVPQSGEQYEYDAAGNLTRGREGQTYAFDGENKMTSYNGGSSQGGATYGYDGDGKRIKKVFGNATTIFVYNTMGQQVAEYSDSPSEGNGTRYLTSDHLGSPRVITDSNGAVKARHDYHPFGEEVGLRGGRNDLNGYVSDNVRQKFTSKERDIETNLDYFLARYYSSTQGRFTSPDEFTGGPDELYYFVDDASANPTFYADLRKPQSLNKYQYAFNNPLRYIDPDGHDGEEADPDVQNPRPVVPVPIAPGFPPLPLPLPGQPLTPMQNPQFVDDIADHIRQEQKRNETTVLVGTTMIEVLISPRVDPNAISAVPLTGTAQPVAPPAPIQYNKPKKQSTGKNKDHKKQTERPGRKQPPNFIRFRRPPPKPKPTPKPPKPKPEPKPEIGPDGNPVNP